MHHLIGAERERAVRLREYPIIEVITMRDNETVYSDRYYCGMCDTTADHNDNYCRGCGVKFHGIQIKTIK